MKWVVNLHTTSRSITCIWNEIYIDISKYIISKYKKYTKKPHKQTKKSRSNNAESNPWIGQLAITPRSMPNDIISWDGILITNDRMPAHQSLSNTHDINMEPPLPICMMYVMYDVWCVEKSIDIHEKLIVLLTNQSVSDISIAKIVCSDDLSSMNPNTVIPALLFSKYVTEKKKNQSSKVNMLLLCVKRWTYSAVMVKKNI